MSGFERKTVLEWQEEGILRVEDGNHGENRPRKDEFAKSGMAFIRAADMNDGAILFEIAEKIDERGQARVRKGIGQPGDVLISHKGTVGRVARAPMDCPPFVCSPQTTFWRVENEGRLDRGYLFSLLRSTGFQVEFAVRSGETDISTGFGIRGRQDGSETGGGVGTGGEMTCDCSVDEDTQIQLPLKLKSSVDSTLTMKLYS